VSTPPKLRTVGLARRYGNGGLTVFEDFSLDVANLEFLAIIGPSGCGKSTLLRIIDGLDPPDAGRIEIDGKPVSGPGGGRAMVFQGFDLFPWRTALENVAFGLEMQGVGRRERLDAARRFIAMVGLSAFDLQTRDLLQDELLRIWQTDRKTVLFVTHSIEEAIYLADRIIVLSPRPARIARDIAVPFARPRDEALKTSPAFLDIRREIWGLLKQEATVA
jgi:NitT/TauT family transport system ATP-binding protein